MVDGGRLRIAGSNLAAIMTALLKPHRLFVFSTDVARFPGKGKAAENPWK
jgi:hypothetical protein